MSLIEPIITVLVVVWVFGLILRVGGAFIHLLLIIAALIIAARILGIIG